MTSSSTSEPECASNQAGLLRIAIGYRRGHPPDESLLHHLQSGIKEQGAEVHVDRKATFGLEWALNTGRKYSASAAHSASQSNAAEQLVGFEIEAGPRLEPSSQPGQKDFSASPQRQPSVKAKDCAPFEVILWNSPGDDQAVIEAVLAKLKPELAGSGVVRISMSKSLRSLPRHASTAPSSSSATKPFELEPVGGAVPLVSRFYLIRKCDEELMSGLAGNQGALMIKGARQIGKTSLLARGLQFMRERNARVALTDFQKLSGSSLRSLDTFYLSLAESLADQLDLATAPGPTWDRQRSPHENFERFVRGQILDPLDRPFVWGLDEMDRLFVTEFGPEVFGLFRSWQEGRSIHPSGPWSKLTLLISYATEAHLFLPDLDESRFNLGARMVLEDFTRLEVGELNARYGHPLRTEAELDRFIALVGGHPYLVRRGLHELACRDQDARHLETLSDHEEGVFGDHLRRLCYLLAKDAGLTETMRSVLAGKSCSDPKLFDRLRITGVVTGTQENAKPRCGLYGAYLRRQLMQALQ